MNAATSKECESIGIERMYPGEQIEIIITRVLKRAVHFSFEDGRSYILNKHGDILRFSFDRYFLTDLESKTRRDIIEAITRKLNPAITYKDSEPVYQFK
jgi:hypothetical protein